MISHGNKSKEPINLNDIDQLNLVSYYLNIKTLPILIHSPLREDKNPSFALFSKNNKVYYMDFSTKDKGSIYDLLMKLWCCSFNECIERIQSDFKIIDLSYYKGFKNKVTLSAYKLNCIIREWEDYDIKYWESFGINLKWLKYSNVYPIKYKIITKDNNTFVYKADKYAYAYVEFKDNKTTLKIYQPFNKDGFKWSNSHDKSVINLWTKLPNNGDKVCICSSLKDALCLWSNTGVPSIALQGEGYNMSDTAINELKRRFKDVYILLDNDEAGLKDAVKLSESTKFTNIILPKFEGGKDISDLYKIKGKKEFKQIINQLFLNN